jgi:hypothetical protein
MVFVYGVRVQFIFGFQFRTYSVNLLIVPVIAHNLIHTGPIQISKKYTIIQITRYSA